MVGAKGEKSGFFTRDFVFAAEPKKEISLSDESHENAGHILRSFMTDIHEAGATLEIIAIFVQDQFS